MDGDDPRVDMQAAVNRSPEAILTFSNEGVVQSVTPMAESLLRLPAAHLVGSRVSEFLPLASVEETLALLRDSTASGVAASLSVRYPTGPADVRELMLTFFPLDTADPPGTFGAIVRDATAQREGERAQSLLKFFASSVPVGVLQLDASGACIESNGRWSELCGLGNAASLQGGWLTAVHPDDLDRISAACTSTVNNGLECRVEFRIAHPDGHVPWVVAHAVRTADGDGTEPRTLMFVVDVTELRAAREVAVRSESLKELALTSDLLEPREGLLKLLQNIAERARVLTSARFAAISIFDDQGKLERFVYTGMAEDVARRLGNPPEGRGLLGRLARDAAPLRLTNLRTHPAYTGWPEGHPEMEAFVGVPIRAGGVTIGSLYMTRMVGDEPFSETDQFGATLLALQVALSVSAAVAQERRGRLSLLEERVRIAHDLHDGTIQSLYALGLEFDGARHRPGLSAELDTLFEKGVSRINRIISDIREYIRMLEAPAPAGIPDLSRDIPHAIQQLVPPGVDTVVNITAPALQELRAREVEDLLFIVREALSNAARHGQPTKIAVDLRQTHAETTLIVQDNGTGFDAATVRRGLGTTTMMTRASRLGAALTVIGLPGMGTTVRVALPRFAVEADELEDES
ncbi:MAG: GAF domain-containing protein [Dehalococcoidia bacterium]